MALLSYEQAQTEAGQSTTAEVSVVVKNLGDLTAVGLNFFLIAMAAGGIMMVGYAMWQAYKHNDTHGQQGKSGGATLAMMLIGAAMTAIPGIAFLLRNSIIS